MGKREIIQENIDSVWSRIQQGESMSLIGRDYNCSRETIGHILRKNGLKAFDLDTRKYKPVDDFFSIINSEIKAYLLGFFYADGTITKDDRLAVRLSQKDVEIQKLFQKFICPSKKIEENLSHKSPSSIGINRKPTCVFRFKSKKMILDLAKYNIVNNKTTKQDAILRHIPENMRWHFLRGFMDGDGHICNGKNRYGFTFVCANKVFVDEVVDFLKSYNIDTAVRKHKNKSEFWSVSKYDGFNSYKFLSLLYADYTYCLRRKEIVALEQLRRYREGCSTNSLCNA